MMLGLRAGRGENKPKIDVPGHYFGHMPASWLSERFGLSAWRKVFSFGFVRNPWDRMVSVCARINPNSLVTPSTFTRWLYMGCLDQTEKPHTVFGGTFIHFPCSSFVLPCSYIGRYETFTEDVERICKIIGQPVPVNQHYEQRARKPYQSYYTTESRNWVERHCWLDIQTFGYRFDE